MKSYNQTLRLVSFLLIALGLRSQEPDETNSTCSPDSLFIAPAGGTIVDSRNGPLSSTYQLESLDASIYPNPANDKIHVALPVKQHLNGNITIMSIEGKEVFTKSFRTEDANSLTVSTASIPAGIYIVDLHTTTGRFVEKIIVQK